MVMSATSLTANRLGGIIGANVTYLDDTLLRLGTNNDQVLLSRSTTLAANTALTNVLIGTPVSLALAAKSLIISNVTSAGSVAMYANRGGNSEQFLFYDTANGVLYLMANFGGTMLGLAASPPAPDNAEAHIWDGSAGVVTASANRQLIVESSGDVGISILSPAANSAYVEFGSPSSATQARLQYAHGTNTLWLRIQDVNRLAYSAGAFAFQEATTVSTTVGALTLAPVSGSNLALTVAGAGNIALTFGTGTITGAVFSTFTMADVANIVLNATTGTIIGTATTQKLGFYNAVPIVRRSGAAQAAVATTASTQTTPYGYTTAAQADAIVTLVNELRAWAVAQGFIAGA